MPLLNMLVSGEVELISESHPESLFEQTITTTAVAINIFLNSIQSQVRSPQTLTTTTKLSLIQHEIYVSRPPHPSNRSEGVIPRECINPVP